MTPFGRRWAFWIAVVIGGLAIGAWLLPKITPTVPPHETIAQHREEQGAPEHDEGTASNPASGPAMEAVQAYAMVSPAKQQLIGVTTAVVERRPLETTIRALGRVGYDEQRMTHVNLRISGWVEDLFVDYTGQFVRKDQPLLTLYSPDLVATQDEYLLALRTREKVDDSPVPEVKEQAERMLESARQRLRLWTLSDRQIEGIARRGRAKTNVTIFSPVSGYVVDKNVFKGMFVEPSVRLYTIADLSKVWVNADIYEFEVPFVRVGQPVEVAFSSYPGEIFHGRVSYLYPYLNEQTRTVKVRVDLPNPGLRLKPEMYGEVRLKVDRGNRLAIPESALLDSGARKLVFVVRGEGLFEPREVKAGPKVGAYYEIREGLAPGDRIVTSGNFLIDSESKLMAATNMMGALGMGGIKMEQARMGEMDMGDMKTGGATSEHPPTGRQEKTITGVKIALSTDPSPPRIGDNRIRIHTTAGSPKSVKLTYTMPMPGMTPATLPMQQREAGIYEATVNLGMGGQWDVTVTIERTGAPPIRATFSVVAGPNMPPM